MPYEAYMGFNQICQPCRCLAAHVIIGYAMQAGPFSRPAWNGPDENCFLGIRRMKQGKLTGFFPKGLQSTLSPGRSCLMSWQLSGTCCAYARVLMGQVGPLERGRNWNCTYHRIWVQRMLMLMWHVNLLERPVRYWFPQKWIREDHLFVMLTRQSVCMMHWNKRDMLTACTRGHMRVTWIC